MNEERIDVAGVVQLHGARALVDGVKAAPEIGRPKWVTPAERALRLGERHERLPFSVASLNTATRGGLAAGKVVAVGGPPGGGKTSWMVQETLGWARTGVHVGILAADEDADGLLIRMGQQLGIDRDHLEQGMPSARAELADAMAAIPTLLLVDAEEEDGASIEAVADELARRRAPGELAVLLLDSLQTCTTSDPRQPRDVRERVDAVVKLMKRLARRLKLIIIATSEIGRGSYNTEDKAKRTSPLAAFKESGGIEYGVALAMVMTKWKEANESGIEVILAKNRLGSHDDLPTIRLRMNSAAASFEEIATPTDEEQERSDHELNEKRCQIVIDVIEQTAAPMTSSNDIIQRIRTGMKKRIRGLGGNRQEWLTVIRDLEAEGRIVRPKKRGERFVVASAVPSSAAGGTDA